MSGSICIPGAVVHSTIVESLTIVSTRDTCDTPVRREYLVVVVADRALLALNVRLADATSRHLFAVLPNGAKQRAAACCVREKQRRKKDSN